MPAPDFSSSRARSESQPINPYAASQVPDAIATPGSQHASDGARDYHARLAWSDRQAFLRAVGFDRLVVIGTSLWWFKYIFDLLLRWSDYFSSNALTDSYSTAMFAIALLAVAQGTFALYLCSLSWKYVNYLREVTGGTTGDFHQWSHLHLRTARYAAASMLLMLVVELATWFVHYLHA